jgi:hypothetical protein
MIVARGEVKAVKRLVRELPVEMLQQCSVRAADADMHCLGGTLLIHHMSALHTFCSESPYVSFLVFCDTLLMLLWSLVA